MQKWKILVCPEFSEVHFVYKYISKIKFFQTKRKELILFVNAYEFCIKCILG